MSFAPVNFTINDVKTRLYGKVTFGTNPTTSMTDSYLSTLCGQAEGIVEFDLNQFYRVPFISKTTLDYAGLPNMTKVFLNNLFVTRSVILVLEVEFGRQSSVVSENYSAQMMREYNTILKRISYKDPKTGQYSMAPLPDLMINTQNWTGLKVVPSPAVAGLRSCGSKDNMRYALQQITNPATSIWSFTGEEGGNCGCGHAPCSCG